VVVFSVVRSQLDNDFVLRKESLQRVSTLHPMFRQKHIWDAGRISRDRPAKGLEQWDHFLGDIAETMNPDGLFK